MKRGDLITIMLNHVIAWPCHPLVNYRVYLTGFVFLEAPINNFFNDNPPSVAQNQILNHVKFGEGEIFDQCMGQLPTQNLDRNGFE